MNIPDKFYELFPKYKICKTCLVSVRCLEARISGINEFDEYVIVVRRKKPCQATMIYKQFGETFPMSTSFTVKRTKEWDDAYNKEWQWMLK